MILLLDVKISDDINSPPTSCTAARLLVESRRLKLKPLFIFLKERQSPKSEKIQIAGLNPLLTKFVIQKIQRGTEQTICLQLVGCFCWSQTQLSIFS